STRTFPGSSAMPYTSPRSSTLMPASGSSTVRSAALTSSSSFSPDTSGQEPSQHLDVGQRTLASPAYPPEGLRLLLVNPALPESFWSFRWALEEVLGGKRSLNPPLGLATLAALCPAHWVVTIADENVEPLPRAPHADLIGIGGMGVQAPRQKELLRRYRAAGYRVVAGGSYASLCPEEYLDAADTVIA